MRWAVIWVVLIGLVLVPFFLFETQFNAFAAEMTRSDTATWLASSSIFGLLALDVFLPVPSSIVSTAAGVLLGFWRGAAIVWAGMMVACVMGYALGARASGLARRFVGDAGLARAERLLTRYGDWTIVICRPVPVLAEASVIFAGLVGAPFTHFLALTALSNLGIAFGYAAFGAFSMSVDSFLVAFLGALIIPGIVMWIARMTMGGVDSRLVGESFVAVGSLSRQSESAVPVGTGLARGSDPMPSPVKTYGLTHVALAVRDPQRSLAFYQAVLGVIAVYEAKNFVQAQTPGSRDVLVFERRPRQAGKAGGVAHFGFRLRRPPTWRRRSSRSEPPGGRFASMASSCRVSPTSSSPIPTATRSRSGTTLPTPVDPPGSRSLPPSLGR